MVGSVAQPPVLLVGDVGPRLEGDLQLLGLSTLLAPTANDAVQRMKGTRVSFVVVPPRLSDMGGVDFVQGVLRHFEASVVLYGNGVDPGEVNALLRTGRVAHFPAHADAQVVADFLARRAGTPPPSTPGPTPSMPSPTSMSGTVLSGLSGAMPASPGFRPDAGARSGPTPSTGPLSPSAASSSLPRFNLTPHQGVPAPGSSGGFPSPSNTSPGLSAALFGDGSGSMPLSPSPPAPRGGDGSLSSVATSFPPSFAPPGPIGTPAPPMPPAAPPGSASDWSPAQKLEIMADDLARTNAELVATRNQLLQSEAEKMALQSEVEAARRGAIAQVAEVMALSDEGDPITEELSEAKAKVADLDRALAAARAEASVLRAERDALASEGAARAQQLGDAQAAADKAKSELLIAHNERLELDKQLSDERATVDRLAAQARSVEQQLEQERQAGEQAFASAEEEQRRTKAIEGQLAEEKLSRAGLEAALESEKRARLDAEERVRAIQNAARGNSDVEAALRTEIEKLRGDVGSARTDATTVRLDLQEAIMRLDEASVSLQAITGERDALRAEVGPLREWGNKLVQDHALQQQEIERLRVTAEQVHHQTAGLDDLRTEMVALQAERDRLAGQLSRQGAVSPDLEVVVQHSRKLADLVRALEPFMWGLQQAVAFYQKAHVDGADGHLRSLLQLQGVLLRLRDEIAMLDLEHVS